MSVVTTVAPRTRRGAGLLAEDPREHAEAHRAQADISAVAGVLERGMCICEGRRAFTELEVPVGESGVAAGVANAGLVVERAQGARPASGHAAVDRLAVDAHHRQQLAHRAQPGDRLRLVQRRQRAQRRQLVEQVVVDDGRPVPAGPAVDDPVADRVDRTGPGEQLAHGAGLPRTVPPLEPQLLGPVLLVHHGQLEAARPGVDDQDPTRHQPSVAQSPITQSRTSGRSSRCSRTYARCSASFASHQRSRASAPRGVRRALLIASITRW